MSTATSKIVPVDRPNEFALRVHELEVKSAQHVSRRTAMTVLCETRRQPELAKSILVEHFREEPAGVA